MGVFVTGRQVALEIDMPGWWLANASVDMDFRRGLYYDSSTVNPRAATDFLSCTRASVGYAKNADGTLTQFASNALRIGVGTGLLVEDARTNLITQSQDFTTSWSTAAVTATADQAAAPDGTTTMDKIDDGTGSGRHIVYQSVTTTGSYSVFSVFAKDINRQYIQVCFDASSNEYAYFDLQNGTVTATGGGLATATIEAYANGIYRCVIVKNSVGAMNTVVALSDRSTQTGSFVFGNPDYVGTNKSVYLWGAQCESASFPSSYIPTTSSSATRAADSIATSSTLQSVINNATASLVAQTDNGEVSSVAANIVDSNGTNLLGFDATNHALASISATLATGNTGNRTTQDKLGQAWDASGRSLVLNGGTVVTDATAQTPSSTQHIGSSGSANFAYAYIKRLTAFNTKLANATLQGFTA